MGWSWFLEGETMKRLTKEEHRKRHIELHKAFDELLADFITQTENLPSKTSVFELVHWSHQQTIEPTEKEK